MIILYSAAIIIDVTIESSLRTKYRQSQITDTTAKLNTISRLIQSKIEKNVSTINSVHLYISMKPNISNSEFKDLAEKSLTSDTMIRSILLTDGFTVKTIYPENLENKLVGVDLSKIPGQKGMAIRVSKTPNTLVDGPFALVQGNYGILCRQAIFHNGRFVSMISSVIGVDKLIKYTNAEARRNRIRIAFRRSGESYMSFGYSYLFHKDSGAIIIPMKVAGLDLELAALPENGISDSFPYEQYIHFYIFLFVLLSTILVVYKHLKVRENINLNTLLTIAQSIGQLGSFICYTKKQSIILSDEVYRILRRKHRKSITVDDFISYIAEKDKNLVRTALMHSERRPTSKTEINFDLAEGDKSLKLTAVPMFNINNEYIGLKGIVSDTTEQKRILNSLKNSEERFRDLVLCTSDIVWEMDTDCRYTYLTGSAKEIYGLDPGEMIGTTPALINGESGDSTASFFCNTIVRNGLPIKDMERWVKDKNGVNRCFLINGMPFFDEAGNLKGYRGVDKDITEQFKLKTEREMIFRVSRDGLAVIDNETRFLDCNQAYVDMTGYSYEQLMTMSCYDMVPEEDKIKSFGMINDLLRVGHYDKYEKNCITKSGKIITVQMTLSVITENKILVSSRDITEIRKYQMEIQRREAVLKAIFNVSPIPMVLLDLNNIPLMVNKTFEDTFGYNYDDIHDNNRWWQLAYPDPVYRNEMSMKWFSYVEDVISGVDSEPVQAVVTCKDGSRKTLVFMFAALEEQGVVVAYDMTERITGEKKLQEYIRIVDENVSISRSERDGIITSVSDAFCRMCGYTKAEVIGSRHEMLHNSDFNEEKYETLRNTIMSGKSWHGEIHKVKKDGTGFWTDTLVYPVLDETGMLNSFMAIDQDITDKKRIEELSVTDKLTGIFNRIRLDEVLYNEFLRFKRFGNPFSAILFDIDFFKRVNDTYGHLIGDEVLKGLARLVKTSVRQCDVFGRWGGEEFLIICTETDLEGAHTLAEKLRAKLEEHIFPEVQHITCSFGVAEIDNDGTDTLIKHADDALYKAKQTGRNRVESHNV